MKAAIRLTAGTLAVAAIIVTAIAVAQNDQKGHEGHEGMSVSKAIAVMMPTEGYEGTGVVTFTKQADGILIEARFENLEPNSEHGFHVHQYGDLSSADAKAMGGHFNPHGTDHAGPEAEMRHVGDFGNVKADDQGVVTFERLDKHIKFSGAENIIGRGLVLHAGIDDLKSQPSGDAGARMAQGVIGVDEGE